MRRLPLLVLLALAACAPEPKPRSLEDIAAACDDQFGKGSESSADCHLKIVVDDVRKDQARRMDAADTASRR